MSKTKTTTNEQTGPLININRLADLHKVQKLEQINWQTSPMFGRYVVIDELSPCCSAGQRVTPGRHPQKLEFKVVCLWCGNTLQRIRVRPAVELTALEQKAPGQPGEMVEPVVIETRPVELSTATL